MLDIHKASDWREPDGFLSITVVDAHCGGEPLRVVIDGLPEIPGATVLQRRRYMMSRHDDLRRAIMLEPRGHADMYGCMVMPPVSEGADFAVLFLHNQGYSTMCGHGIIAVSTVVLEMGMLEAGSATKTLQIDTPAGPVLATASIGGGRVTGVQFRNVPSWVEALDAEVDVPGIGRIRYDLAFGGAYYAVVAAESVGLTCAPGHVSGLIEKGRAIKQAVAATRPIHHPVEEDLGFIYGTIFTGPPEGDGAHSRNVCVFADGEVDRSPTGTGVSARAAIHYARGEVRLGQSLTIESIVGSRFSVQIVEETSFGPHTAVVPEVGGAAYITGVNRLLIDPQDPFREGFLLR